MQLIYILECDRPEYFGLASAVLFKTLLLWYAILNFHIIFILYNVDGIINTQYLHTTSLSRFIELGRIGVLFLEFISRG